LVNQPIGVLVQIANKLSLWSHDEVEPSESKDIPNVLDFWRFGDIVGVDVNCGEFVELDVGVVDVGFVVEEWVDDLEFGDVFVSVIVSERFRYIDDNTVRKFLVPVGFGFSDVSLGDFVL